MVGPDTRGRGIEPSRCQEVPRIHVHERGVRDMAVARKEGLLGCLHTGVDERRAGLVHSTAQQAVQLAQDLQ